MNRGASDIVANSFLTGGLDVLDALMSKKFSYTISDLSDVDAGQFADYVARFPVCFMANLVGGGGVAFLNTTKDASILSSLTLTGEVTPADALDDEALSTLKEISNTFLGAGISNIAEKYELDINLENHDVVPSVDAGALTTLIGVNGTVATCSYFSEPDVRADAILVFAQDVEGLVPAEVADAAAGVGTSPSLSEAEMTDILSGFTPEEGAAPAPGAPVSQGAVPENLDIVLDLKLTVTARLGRIEMPIGEILTLGAGSIMEVGHLVDDPVELLVNGKLIARGDVVVVDEKFGLRITEIVSAKERIESLR